jgi:hypothetical protein
MAKKKSSRTSPATLLPEAVPLKFDQKLVLLQWMLWLFDKKSFEQLAEPFKSAQLEGLNEDNNHKFLAVFKEHLFGLEEFPGDVLLGYDQNIVRHTLRLNERRAEPIRWKYFQWLSLVFTEVYLDRFFRDPNKLLADLNEFVAKFNEDKLDKDKIPAYELADLRRIAFWNATGSGKTLLMHVNILQYQHYLELHGKGRELNRIILLTPNEGLSKQHLVEFQAAGLDANLFSKDGKSLFTGKTIEIIDIHKLREDSGEKTVAIDAFEGRNLVLVDEGHRGSSGKEAGRWMDARRRLCEHGFSFEYSATFGQAMKASSNKALEQEYAKCILFDYSYKYFYRDGFGKDYRILNLADDSDDEKRRLYLTACLLAFYQQQRLYRDKPAEFRPFLLENPLWVFVGGSVNAVRSENKKKVSDVVDILLFLAEFVKDKRHTIQLLDRLISGKPGLLDQRGNEIFATAFGYLSQTKQTGEEMFGNILNVLFNSPTPAKLHVLNLKGTDGEIALRLGENDAFGLINVGDAANLCKLCEEHSDFMAVDDKEFSGSLIAPDFREDEWTNDKSEMRRAVYDYWTVGHVLATGIIDPDSNDLVQFDSLRSLAQFYRSVLRRRSASDYEKEISRRYVEYLQNSDDVESEPFLIPELRYAGRESEHLYRLDFTILNPHTMSFVGFEISPSSTHNAVTKIKARTQKDVNAELAKKWGREMAKRNRYFQEFGIATVTFTDDDLTDMDACFSQIEACLSQRPDDETSIEEQLEAINALTL